MAECGILHLQNYNIPSKFPPSDSELESPPNREIPFPRAKFRMGSPDPTGRTLRPEDVTVWQGAFDVGNPGLCDVGSGNPERFECCQLGESFQTGVGHLRLLEAEIAKPRELCQIRQSRIADSRVVEEQDFQIGKLCQMHEANIGNPRAAKPQVSNLRGL